MRVLLICGSAAAVSHTAANVRLLAALLRAHGAEADIWDLVQQPLPFHNPRDHFDPLASPDPTVRAWAECAARADGFVWATPVYHNGYSGVLKNALDNLNIRQLKDKPVALASHGSVQPCDQLRIVVRGLLAVAIPTQVVTQSDDFELREGGYELINDRLRERMERAARELVAYGRALAELRHGAFD